MFVHYFKIITYFLYVCQSISWLTFLQILGKYRDISCSWWDIFLKFLGDILGLFVHFFQIITDFLYVCQSISWLTSIMKLGQYRDISYSGWDIFLKIFGHITGMFLHYFQINANFLYVCQSVSWLTSLQILNEYRHIICSDWDIFLNFFWHISGMFAHYFQIIANFLFVCQYVSWVTSLLIVGQNRDISWPGWDIFLKFLETFLSCLYTFTK